MPPSESGQNNGVTPERNSERWEGWLCYRDEELPRIEESNRANTRFPRPELPELLEELAVQEGAEAVQYRTHAHNRILAGPAQDARSSGCPVNALKEDRKKPIQISFAQGSRAEGLQHHPVG